MTLGLFGKAKPMQNTLTSVWLKMEELVTKGRTNKIKKHY